MPKVSVVIPAYNATRYLEATVHSVLTQTFQDFEILIVDDCSKDDTWALMQSLAEKDDRIICLRNEKNSGVAETRNYAVKQARGEWIAFLDSDDVWREDKLEKQLALIAEEPTAALTYTASSFMDQDSKPYSYIMEVPGQVDYRTLLGRNVISCSSVMVKKSVMERYPMGSSQTSEDYGAWLRILREVQYAYGVNEPLLCYRVARGSKSSNRLKAAGMHYRTYRDVGYTPLVSGWLTFCYTFYSVSKRRHLHSGG